MKDNFHTCALSDWMTYGITTWSEQYPENSNSFRGEKILSDLGAIGIEHSGGDPSGSYMQLGGPDTGI